MIPDEKIFTRVKGAKGGDSFLIHSFICYKASLSNFDSLNFEDLKDYKIIDALIGTS